MTTNNTSGINHLNTNRRFNLEQNDPDSFLLSSLLSNVEADETQSTSLTSSNSPISSSTVQASLMNHFLHGLPNHINTSDELIQSIDELTTRIASFDGDISIFNQYLSNRSRLVAQNDQEALARYDVLVNQTASRFTSLIGIDENGNVAEINMNDFHIPQNLYSTRLGLTTLLAAQITDVLYKRPDALNTILERGAFGSLAVLFADIVEVPDNTPNCEVVGLYFGNTNVGVLDLDFYLYSTVDDDNSNVQIHELIGHALDADGSKRPPNGLLPGMTEEERQNFVRGREFAFEHQELKEIRGYAFTNEDEFLAATMEMLEGPESAQELWDASPWLYKAYASYFGIDPLGKLNEPINEEKLRIDKLNKALALYNQKYEQIIRDRGMTIHECEGDRFVPEDEAKRMLNERFNPWLENRASLREEMKHLETDLEEAEWDEDQAKIAELNEKINKIKEDLRAYDVLVERVANKIKANGSDPALVRLTAAQIVDAYHNRPDLINKILSGEDKINIELRASDGRVTNNVYDDLDDKIIFDSDTLIKSIANKKEDKNDIVNFFTKAVDDIARPQDGILPFMGRELERAFITERDKISHMSSNDPAVKRIIDLAKNNKKEFLAVTIAMFGDDPQALFDISPTLYGIYARYLGIDPLGQVPNVRDYIRRTAPGVTFEVLHYTTQNQHLKELLSFDNTTPFTAEEALQINPVDKTNIRNEIRKEIIRIGAGTKGLTASQLDNLADRLQAQNQLSVDEIYAIRVLGYAVSVGYKNVDANRDFNFSLAEFDNLVKKAGDVTKLEREDILTNDHMVDINSAMVFGAVATSNVKKAVSDRINKINREEGLTGDDRITGLTFSDLYDLALDDTVNLDNDTRSALLAMADAMDDASIDPTYYLVDPNEDFELSLSEIDLLAGADGKGKYISTHDLLASHLTSENVDEKIRQKLAQVGYEKMSKLINYGLIDTNLVPEDKQNDLRFWDGVADIKNLTWVHNVSTYLTESASERSTRRTSDETVLQDALQRNDIGYSAYVLYFSLSELREMLRSSIPFTNEDRQILQDELSVEERLFSQVGLSSIYTVDSLILQTNEEIAANNQWRDNYVKDTIHLGITDGIQTAYDHYSSYLDFFVSGLKIEDVVGNLRHGTADKVESTAANVANNVRQLAAALGLGQDVIQRIDDAYASAVNFASQLRQREQPG